jgi:SAM-dependent methyltransferase
MAVSALPAEGPLLVPETRFGHWFLGTETWFQSVLKVAILDLNHLIGARSRSYPVIVDVGCGQGRSLRMLKIVFRAARLIGVEPDGESLAIAQRRIEAEGLPATILQNDCAAIDLPDASADMVFCHQTFHHLVQQDRALTEFYRILRPGGLLLFSESTRAYIHSWIIRLLFAHPMDVQRTAEEYMALLRAHGFEFEPHNVSFPYPWWSRPDLGLLEAVGLSPGAIGRREETLVNIAARKAV